ICPGDRGDAVVINDRGDIVEMPRGASDACLGPYHIERGMLSARERFAKSRFVDEERIAAAIEFTRFPVPEDDRYPETASEPALVRAADLVGQLGDPSYHRGTGGLYQAWVEIGGGRTRGYTGPADVVERYPEFFWSRVQRLSGGALRYLEQ